MGDDKVYGILYTLDNMTMYAVKLNAETYSDALKIAKCFCGEKAEKALLRIPANSSIFYR
jgi:hypothetical protein